MKLYEELSNAMNEVVSVTEESSDFKPRFTKLIENYFDSSYVERDIDDVIELINLSEGNSDGN
jgi:hypothetical protein